MDNLNEQQEKILESLLVKQTIKTKFKWDENFQRRILGIYLTDKDFRSQGINLIKAEYFTNECHGDIYKVATNVFEKYGFIPDKGILETLLSENIKDKSEAVKIYYLSELQSIYDYFIPNHESRSLLLDKLLTFAKMQSLRLAMDESQKELKKDPDSEETWVKIHDRFRDAMNINRNFDIGFEYFAKLDDFFNELNKEETKENLFTSGFISIDNALSGGGCRRGEIYGYIALAGKGKSLALVKTAVENLKKGFKVLFISVEMDWVSISKRFTSQYCGFSFNELQDYKTQIKEFIDYSNMNFDEKNRFIIKAFPSNSIDAGDIRAYINQLDIYGFRPDVLVVDYPGEMKDTPGIPTWESKYRIIRDLRGIAGEKQLIVFTALQANKASSQHTNTDFIEEGNIGTSYDMFKPLDGLWSINQTTDEANAEVGRIFVIKHRNGNSRFYFPIKYDKEILNISEIKMDEYRAILHNKAKMQADQFGLVTPDVVLNDDKEAKPKRSKKLTTNDDIID